jgi:hypothetical protein
VSSASRGPTKDTCMSYEEEDTCMSYEEEDTCQVATNRLSLYVYASVLSYEEEDTCQVATKDIPCIP